MLPFDLDTPVRPVLSGPGREIAPILPPVIKAFDPRTERLTFQLDHDDSVRALALRDLENGEGVRVEVGSRLLVTVMGCVADDLPEDCLTFEFVD